MTINVKGIELYASYSKKIRIKYDDERIETKKITDPDELKKYIKTVEHLKDDINSDVNDWSHVENSSSMNEWTTTDGNSVTIKENRKNKLVISDPLPFTDETSVKNWGSAKFVAVLFMIRNKPRSIDYKVCRDNTAYDVLREIEGVGDGTAKKLISRDIYTYDDLLANKSIIPRRFRSEAEDQIQERIDNGDILLSDERLLDEFADYMTAHKI